MSDYVYLVDLENDKIRRIPVVEGMLAPIIEGEIDSEPVAYSLDTEHIAFLLQSADGVMPDEVKKEWTKIANDGGGLFIIP
jgi:hypothetical protein